MLPAYSKQIQKMMKARECPLLGGGVFLGEIGITHVEGHKLSATTGLMWCWEILSAPRPDIYFLVFSVHRYRYKGRNMEITPASVDVLYTLILVSTTQAQLLTSNDIFSSESI
jgi:hypothetical protein